eukprot:4012779-Pyramimonas_sp.AAC.1
MHPMQEGVNAWVGTPTGVLFPRRCPASPGDRTSRAPRISGRRPQGGRWEEAASSRKGPV